MRYGELKCPDIANGLGIRVSLFVSGCTHHCKGCFNAVTWDFNYGEVYSKETEEAIISLLSPDYIHGLSLLGGEPFEVENQGELVSLLRRVRLAYPKKNIWCYTGYVLEELTGQIPSRCRGPQTDEMLAMIDVLVDGRFVEEKKDISLRFRGSSNQRILDLPASLKEGKAVLHPLHQ